MPRTNPRERAGGWTSKRIDPVVADWPWRFLADTGPLVRKTLEGSAVRKKLMRGQLQAGKNQNSTGGNRMIVAICWADNLL